MSCYSGLARAVLAEMLGVSAHAFGGLQTVLQGAPMPARQPPRSVGTGLRQAADAVASGFGAFPGLLGCAYGVQWCTDFSCL